MRSAPARLMAVRCSRATASPSIQPRSAAALIIEYSPDTWYAATGRSTSARAAGDHVEVGEGGLHHDDVGALGDVGADLGQRLAAVARVLLVALAVAAVGDRDVDRVAERAVERRGVLGRVGEDRGARRGRRRRGRARMARDLAVHHPARAPDVGPGVGLGDGGPLRRAEGGVVVDLAVGVDDPAVAVVGVLVDAEVGDEHELVADLVAQVAQRELHDARRDPRPPSPRRPCAAGTPKRMTAGMPRSASSATSLRSDSRVCCTTPGRLAIGCGSSMPSRTNSGATRSSTPSRVSATSRRRAGVRRSRRSRRWGKAIARQATGAPRP